MNILYLVKHFPCLSQTFVLNEVRALTRSGCAVHVVSAIDLKEPIELDRVTASRVTYLQHGYLYRYGAAGDPSVEEDLCRQAGRALTDHGSSTVPVGERRRLWNVLTEHEPDPPARARGFLDALGVVSLARAQDISHLHCDFAEDNVKLACLVHRATGIPFTFKARAYDIFAEPPRDLAAWAAAAARVFTISRYNRDHLCRQWGIPPEKVVVIYDGVSLEQTPPIARYVHRPFRIVSVSRLVEKKGFPVLLEACRILKDRFPFQCDIIGDGPMMAPLRDRLSALGLDGIVTLHGARSHAAALDALGSASVFVLPCIEAKNGDRDATPNSLLEAMARGLPVVSTRLSGIPEIVDDGKDGLLVESGDAGTLAEAIARIRADRELAEATRRAARRKIESRFRIEQTVARFLGELQADHAGPAGRTDLDARREDAGAGP